MDRQTKLQPLPGTPSPNRRWETPEGHIIAGDILGDPANPAVILLHGGGQTRHAWKGACEALVNGGYYTIALDARGHGDSSWVTDGNYHLPDMMTSDLAYVVNELGLEKPILIGASMGGMVAIHALGQGLFDAAGLILVDIVPAINSNGTDRILAFMAQGRQGFDNLEEVAEAITSYQPQRKAKRSLDGLAKNVRLGEDGRYYWHWDPNIFKNDNFDAEALFASIRQSTSSLDIPVLLVRGALSDIVTDEGVDDFNQLCPHAEYVNVAGASHMVAGDRNDAFVDAIVDFIDRRLSARQD